jgi:hypothetical protein
MPLRITWTGGEPHDRDDWENRIRAEYGTATEPVVVHFEKVGEGFVLTGAPSRFLRALQQAGKPVSGPATGEAAEADELEAVGVDALNARTEKARREGGSGE